MLLGNNINNERINEVYMKKSHGSLTFQVIHSLRRESLLHGNKLPSLRDSSHATDTVGQNVFAYGKAKPNSWDFDASHQNHKHTTSKAGRRDKRQNGTWVFNFVEKKPSQPTPVANTKGVFNPSITDRENYRITVEVKNKETGEKEERRFRIRKVVVSILSYGQLIQFSRTNKNGTTFRDSRTNKTLPLSFAKSELIRLCGVTEGMAKFAELSARI